MPSTRTYMAYAAVGIATFAGSTSSFPSFSYQLNLEPADMIVSNLYQSDNSETTLLPAISVARGDDAYPKIGKAVFVNAKIKLTKNVPTLEKETYNFQIYEG